MTYGSQGGERVTGNPFSNSKGITFSGSGELDNGFTVSTGYTMTNAAFSSSYVSLDMGDAGTLSLMNSTALAGIDKYDDVMPTAGEEVWDDVDADDNGVVGTTSANAIGYEVSAMGLTISASYAKEALGTANSIVLIADDLMDGLQVGYGTGKAVVSSTVENDHSTAWAKYTAGMATVGIQTSSIDAASADEDRLGMAISLAVNEKSDVLPKEFALHDNFPNPFNPNTTIRFDLPRATDVSIVVFNLLGQKIKTIERAQMNPGYHSIIWNATNDFGSQVSAGMYFYQLRTNEFVKTKKMILLK